MKDGLQTENVKIFKVAYLWPDAALYNLICFFFLFWFPYVVLYRLLHNKS